MQGDVHGRAQGEAFRAARSRFAVFGAYNCGHVSVGVRLVHLSAYPFTHPLQRTDVRRIVTELEGICNLLKRLSPIERLASYNAISKRIKNCERRSGIVMLHLHGSLSDKSLSRKSVHVRDERPSEEMVRKHLLPSQLWALSELYERVPEPVVVWQPVTWRTVNNPLRIPLANRQDDAEMRAMMAMDAGGDMQRFINGRRDGKGGYR